MNGASTMKKFLLAGAALAIGALSSAAALAQSAASQTILIQNARLITSGPQGVIENGDVLLRDGVIAGVGVDLAAPEGANVIDAAGRTITAGFIAPFSQLGIEEISLDREANDASPDPGFPLSAALNSLDAYNPTSSVIAVERAGGITRALISPQAGDKLFAGKAAVIDLSGRVASVTKANAAQLAMAGYSGAARSGDTRMGAWAMLREYLSEAAPYAANPRDYLLRKREDRFFISDLEALGPVVAGREPLIISANSAADIRNVIRLKSDYSLNVIILGGSEAWRVARELAAANIPVILDAMQNLPAQFEDLGSTMANAARLQAAGVTIAFFNDGGTPHNMRLLPQYAGNAVAHGLPYDAAIAALTINPAKMFGVDAKLGSVEIGKAGDIVVWDGDPLEVTTRPVAVFIDGRAMSMENRQTKLRDRYKDLSKGDLPFAYRGEE